MSESREVALARELYQIELDLKQIKDREKALNEKWDVAEKELIELLATEGKKDTGHIEGVGVFGLRREAYPSVANANMPTFVTYLKKIGEAALVQETVHPSTAKSWCKQKIAELTEKFTEDEDEATKAHAFLGVTDELLAPEQLATRYLAKFGVTSFEKVSLSHRNKGK